MSAAQSDSRCPDDVEWLRLSNAIIRLDQRINAIEHQRLNLLGDNGDPILSDAELSHLNILQCRIMFLFGIRRQHERQVIQQQCLVPSPKERLSRACRERPGLPG